MKRRRPETVPGVPVEGISAFREPYVKIKRHKEHIPDTIRRDVDNARVEARNNKIKLIICGV